MSKSEKLQFLAQIQECCRRSSLSSDDNTAAAAAVAAAQDLETLAHTFSKEHGLSLEEILQLKDARKRTILHYVCRSSSSSSLSSESSSSSTSVDSLLEPMIFQWCPNPETRQAILKQKDKDGLTCLMMAVQQQQQQQHPHEQTDSEAAAATIIERRVLQLLHASPKLALVRSKGGATALHYAAGAGASRTIIETLWQHGKVALQTFALHGGGTPLHWACSSSNAIPITIQTLIECGADVNAIVNGGGSGSGGIPTPLALALAVGQNTNVCSLLELSPEIDVDRVASGGNTTFLHLAVEHNLPDAVKLLLAKLVDDSKKKEMLQCKDKNCRTPMDIAIQQNHPACMELLQRASGSPEHSLDGNNISVTSVVGHETPKHSIPKDDDTGTKEESSSDDTMTTEEQQALDLFAKPKLVPKALQESAKLALTFKIKGNTHFQRKEWQEAHDCYSAAIASNSKNATFYANRSACQIQLGNPRDALVDAVLARKLRPQWTKPCYRKAVALLELQRHQDAALAAYEGLRLEPSNAELQKLLRTIVKLGREVFQQHLKEATYDGVEPPS